MTDVQASEALHHTWADLEYEQAGITEPLATKFSFKRDFRAPDLPGPDPSTPATVPAEKKKEEKKVRVE